MRKACSRKTNNKRSKTNPASCSLWPCWSWCTFITLCIQLKRRMRTNMLMSPMIYSCLKKLLYFLYEDQSNSLVQTRQRLCYNRRQDSREIKQLFPLRNWTQFMPTLIVEVFCTVLTFFWETSCKKLEEHLPSPQATQLFLEDQVVQVAQSEHLGISRAYQDLPATPMREQIINNIKFHA